jgi:hypothetical protein
MTGPTPEARERAETVVPQWRPIETVPKGEYVDLWVIGDDDTVDFYCPNASKVKGKPLRHGRTTHWRLCDDGKWRSPHGFEYPLSLALTVTHWMPLPEPPS